MGKNNQPERHSTKIDQGNYYEKVRDYINNINIDFSKLPSFPWLILVTLWLAFTGLSISILLPILFLLLLQNPQVRSEPNPTEDTDKINDLVATEIFNNIATINERWQSTKFLEQKDPQLKQEDFNQLWNIVNNRPFCREIYDEITPIGLNDHWSHKERDAIGQFYTFIEQIDASYKDLAKNIDNTKNINSDSARDQIDLIAKIVNANSIAASAIGEIMIEKLDAKPDINLSIKLYSPDNIRVICDPRLKKSLIETIKNN